MKRPAAENEKVWGGLGKPMLYGGHQIEVFTRAAVAIALNREIVTIRRMEHDDIICHPKLKNSRGHWMYTRDQIRDLVALAEKYGVIDPQKRQSFSEEFSRAAKKVLRRLPSTN